MRNAKQRIIAGVIGALLWVGQPGETFWRELDKKVGSMKIRHPRQRKQLPERPHSTELLKDI